jgi:L-ascorbate metabolism protein UlaG (beta-lactamase superfamily)
LTKLHKNGNRYINAKAWKARNDSVSVLGGMNVAFKLRWLGTACFEMVLPNKKTLMIDPYLDDSVSAPITSDEIKSCDYIFLTHGHYDHVLDVGKLAERFKPKVFCSDVAATSLIEHQNVSPELITRVKPGEIIREDGLRVEILKGYHVNFTKEYKRVTGQDLVEGGSDPTGEMKKAVAALFGSDRFPDQLADWMRRYPQGEQLNFVFDPTGGSRVYMAGSYPEPSIIEVAKQAKAHITLLQVLPGNILPGLEEQTARLAIASGCQIAVPQHHDPLMEGAGQTDLTQLRKIFEEKTDITFQEFLPGKWYPFD